MSPVKRAEILLKHLAGWVLALLWFRPFRERQLRPLLSSATDVFIVRTDNRVGEALLSTPLVNTLAPKYRVHLVVHQRDGRVVAEAVTQVDATVRQLVDDMLETMYAAEGVGLAATQVDVHLRVIVMDTSDTRDQPIVLINPETIWRSEDLRVAEEGCLSVPTIYEKVERHASVKVQALGRDGEPFEMHAEGLAAVCVQHEMDHLRGKVFVEYLSALKRDRIRTKMIKKTRDEQRG